MREEMEDEQREVNEQERSGRRGKRKRRRRGEKGVVTSTACKFCAISHFISFEVLSSFEVEGIVKV